MNAENVGTGPGNWSTLSQSLPLVVGVDLEGTQIRAAVLQGSALLSCVSFLTGEYPSPDRVIPRLFEAVQQALDGAHITLNDIEGIGPSTGKENAAHVGILAAWNNLPPVLLSLVPHVKPSLGGKVRHYVPLPCLTIRRMRWPIRLMTIR